MNRKIIIISAVIIVLIAGYVTALKKFYPVAMVGFRPVWDFDYEENVRAAKQFYEVQGVGQSALRIDWSSEEGRKALEEIRKKVLLTMIENEIVKAALKEEKFKGLAEEAAKKIDELMEEQTGSEDFAKGVALLYGWDLANLRNRLLEPQARRDALAEKLKMDNIDFESWLLEQKQKTIVLTFFAGKWNKEKGEVE